MTLNAERKNSLTMTRELLYALVNPKRSRKVPKDIRDWASRCLRHYPWESHIEALSIKCPDILGEKFEDNFK